MIQKAFANNAAKILEPDENVIGLAAGGSWLSNEMDEFSDLDLVLVTKQKIAPDKEGMIAYAKRLGNFLSGFTGEHVGEPRLLICLFENPLLHVDIKFLTLDEFKSRVENPILLLDKNKQLENAASGSEPKYPRADYQWMEDRFWTWVHYILVKIGRGEYFEAHDSFTFLRMWVFGPLLQAKNKKAARGVRKVETELSREDLEKLKLTLPAYERKSLLESLNNAVSLFRELRNLLFDDSIQRREKTEDTVMRYFDLIEKWQPAKEDRTGQTLQGSVHYKGPFYHGTRADMKVGDLLTAGFGSNYKSELVMNHIYFTGLPNGAGLAAALSKGEGRERVYIVEPTGEFENDPNVTDKKFPGNPTRSYRSQAPLKIVGELENWTRISAEELKKWKEMLSKKKGEIIN